MNQIVIKADPKTHKEIEIWLIENFDFGGAGKRWYRYYRQGEYKNHLSIIMEYVYAFETEADAMHFALRWK